MWSLLPRHWQLVIILAAGAACAWAYDAVMAYLYGEHVSSWKLISFSATLVGVVLVGLANQSWRWLWRTVPWLQSHVFPDVNGEWKGKLISTWKDPKTGEPVPPIDTTITIRQTLFSTTVSLQTGESESHSTRSFLERFPNTNRFKVWYSYNNEPRAQFDHRSTQHEGVAFLEGTVRNGGGPQKLTGRYYTSRKTSGDIDVDRVAS